ncbi:SDR family NAD(P)-dependent oxidoreductase, partial [Steroidobacter sp. S1-65]
MKDSLLPIYRAVSEGRVTQADALEKIKALKQQRRDFVPELLLATRQWVPMRVSNPTRSTNRSRKVLVWGLSSDIVGSLRSRLDCELREIASQRAAAVDVAFSDAAVECFDAIKSLLSAQKAEHAGLLQLVVAEASAVSVAVGLEALLRTANEENPALGVQLLQVPADVDATELQLLCEREAALLDQISVRYRRERGVLERQVMRWQTKVAQSGGPVIFKEAGCYLITGGAGGIGLQFAREIALRTASATIVLAGRSEPSAKVAEDLRTIAARGHRIEYVSVDVTNAEAVETLVRRLETEGRPLNGIIHCAGITRDNFIIRKPIDEFATVLAPKVTGTVNLDRATRHTALDFLVLCSSVAACWGNGGQADYAAANGFMDAFAQHRNRLVQDGERRGRTLSVNWPLWQDGGMSLDAATWQRLQSRTGMRPLQTTSAMRALYEGFAIACDQLLVMEGELSSMQTLLDESDVKVAGADETPAPSARAPVASIHTDAAFKAKALEYLCQQFSRVLKIPVAKLRPHAPLEQYGMDSILAMKLVSHLETLFGRLPKTLAFEYQTIAELSEYFCSSHAARLAEALAPADSSRSVAAPRVAGKRLQEDRNAAFDARRSSKLQQSSKAQPSSSVAHVKDAEPIAIIGLSGRYPDAWNLDEYWQNLKQGKDCIGEVPPQRWRWQDYYRGDAASPGPHSSKWGGFISGADEFDPQFFNISPREAPYIDPQERLFLQHAWMAMEDAGYTRKSLQVPRANGLAGQVGVYVGVMYGEYNRSGSLASIANRVSYVLNLHGPSMTLDTMCSSSLTAIHLACQDLRTGGTDLAIAGGVNLSIHPGKYSMLSAGQFISSAGHCQS